VAPIEARESIKSNGLKPSLLAEIFDWVDSGSFSDNQVYVFTDYSEAKAYAQYMARQDPPSGMDIWKVDITGLNTQPDTGLYSNPYEEDETSALEIFGEEIGPERLSLMSSREASTDTSYIRWSLMSDGTLLQDLYGEYQTHLEMMSEQGYLPHNEIARGEWFREDSAYGHASELTVEILGDYDEQEIYDQIKDRLPPAEEVNWTRYDSVDKKFERGTLESHIGGTFAGRVPFYMFPDGTIEMGRAGDDHHEIGLPEDWIQKGVGGEEYFKKLYEEYGESSFFQGAIIDNPDLGGYSEYWPLDSDGQTEASWIKPEWKELVRAEAQKRLEKFDWKNWEPTLSHIGASNVEVREETGGYDVPHNMHWIRAYDEDKRVGEMVFTIHDHELNPTVYVNYLGVLSEYKNTDTFMKLVSELLPYRQQGYRFDAKYVNQRLQEVMERFLQRQVSTKTAREPTWYKGNLWGNVSYLFKDDQVLVGYPGEHHDNVFSREMDLPTVPGWHNFSESQVLEQAGFQDWEQGSFNFEWNKDTEEVQIYMLEDDPALVEKVKRIGEEHLQQWIKGSDWAAFETRTSAGLSPQYKAWLDFRGLKPGLPQGLELKYKLSESGLVAVVYAEVNGSVVGQLYADYLNHVFETNQPGWLVRTIRVNDDYQRMGLAELMFDKMQGELGTFVYHDWNNQTPPGRGWAQKNDPVGFEDWNQEMLQQFPPDQHRQYLEEKGVRTSANLPENLTLKWDAYQQWGAVEAFVGRTPVGYLGVGYGPVEELGGEDGWKVEAIEVFEPWRGRGLADLMFAKAQDELGTFVYHDWPNQSQEGRGWALKDDPYGFKKYKELWPDDEWDPDDWNETLEEYLQRAGRAPESGEWRIPVLIDPRNYSYAIGYPGNDHVDIKGELGDAYRKSLVVPGSWRPEQHQFTITSDGLYAVPIRSRYPELIDVLTEEAEAHLAEMGIEIPVTSHSDIRLRRHANTELV
jgi:hypothetical protein